MILVKERSQIRENCPGGRRNALKRLISAKEIKGNPRIFL
jgi:hypothetical protein